MNHLKYYREKSGKTQEYMSKLLHVTKAAYCMKEQGKRQFTVSEAILLSDDLGVPIKKIFT